MQPVTIVMTATITPNQNTPLLARSDPSLRMQDYLRALQFYVNCSNEHVKGILFIDNSNSDLSPLEKLVEASATSKKVELISFNGNDHPAEYGKGYGEFRLLDYGLRQSSTLKSEDRFWKVTGRLIVTNIEELIRTSPKNFELYCDLRDVPFIGHALGGNQWMDLRLFGCSVAAYDDIFREIYIEFNQTHLSVSPEQVIFPKINNLVQKNIHKRFYIQPRLEGFGGHKNVSYQSKGYIFKEGIRSITRTVAPWIWL